MSHNDSNSDDADVQATINEHGQVVVDADDLGAYEQGRADSMSEGAKACAKIQARSGTGNSVTIKLEGRGRSDARAEEELGGLMEYADENNLMEQAAALQNRAQDAINPDDEDDE